MPYTERNYDDLAVLVGRLQCNPKDEAAFTQLYEALLPYLAFYARQLTHGDEETSNELPANETYEYLIENIPEVSREFLPAENADSEETVRLVRGMIASLPEVQQQTLIYRYLEQLSIAEIAEVMQCPEATVKSRLRYAEAGIKEQVLGLERQGTKLYALSGPLMYLILRQSLTQYGHMEAATAQAMLHTVKQL